MRNLFLLIVFISNTCIAQKAIPDYLSVPFPTELTGGEDGKTIAWVFNNQGSRNIFVAQAPAFTARQLTSYAGDDGMEISELAFTPDGHTLLFVRGNGSNSNGETANPAQLQQSTERVLWRIDIDGNHLQQINKGSGPAISPDGKQVLFRVGAQVWTASLTDSLKPQQLFIARGFPAQIRWSPDGHTIAFLSNRDDHSFIGLYSFANKSISYPDPTVDLESQPVWSPDGKSLAYINVPNIHNLLPFTPVRSGNPWSIRIVNVSTGEVKELWKATAGKGSIFFDDIPVADNLLMVGRE